MTFTAEYKLQLQHQFHLVMVLWHFNRLKSLTGLMLVFFIFYFLLINLTALLMIFPIPFAPLGLSFIFIKREISLITFLDPISFPLMLIIFFKALQP